MSGIHRGYTNPDADWFKLHNDWARDSTIDWGALGLLAYLTSHQDGFEVALTALYQSRSSKRHKVEGWLVELEQHGYLRRETIRRGGVVTGTVWHLLAPDAGDRH